MSRPTASSRPDHTAVLHAYRPVAPADRVLVRPDGQPAMARSARPIDRAPRRDALAQHEALERTTTNASEEPALVVTGRAHG